MKTCLTFNPRLHPIASGWARLLNQDVVISGYNVPANVSILSLFLPIFQFFFLFFSLLFIRCEDKNFLATIFLRKCFWVTPKHSSKGEKSLADQGMSFLQNIDSLTLPEVSLFLRDEKDSAWIEKNLCWACVRIKILHHPGLIAVQQQQQTNIAENFKRNLLLYNLNFFYLFWADCDCL